MSLSISKRLEAVMFAAWVFAVAAIPLLATTAPAPPAGQEEHFFIISSVDLRKRVLFLRHPTDVTTVMDVTPRTEFQDENGKKIGFSDLHAGNTVYVTFSNGPKGVPVAIRVRKGPMTLQSLHQRYLHFK